MNDSRLLEFLVHMARGHALYEQSLACPHDPVAVHIGLLGEICMKTRIQRIWDPANALWPEVGSRAMQRLVQAQNEWVVVEPGRYRYSTIMTEGIVVRIVLHEHIAVEVEWASP
jgi:hypothetical protein